MHPLIRATALFLFAAAAVGFVSQQPRYWTPLNPEEAKSLAYLTPYAAEHRKAGLDVNVVTGCDVPGVQKPFLAVELVSTHPFGGGGVEDHEYVVVNLNTAEVLDPIQVPAAEINSTELFGVAAIMRQAHQIDGRVIERYAALQPQLTDAQPCQR
jgi:alpha-D-ribose 1-methylphosphonate 5-phosphate C-P lyase